MSIISNLNGSGVTTQYTSQRPQQAASATLSSDPLPPASKDIFMPGTDANDRFQTYTHYHKSGGVFRYGAEESWHHEQGYMAITFVATPGPGVGSPYSQGILTAADIDITQPGAVFDNGQWTPAADYFKDAPKTNAPTVDDRIAIDFDEAPLDLDLDSDERKVDPSTLGRTLQRLMASPDQLAENPGLLWTFTGADSVFQGHDILNGIFDQVYSSVESRERVVDEYGYTFSMPGWTPNEDFTMWSRTIAEDGQPRQTIDSADTSNFAGLALEERDTFFATVQTIFDKHHVDLNARTEDYGYTSSGTPGCDQEFAVGGWAWSNSALDQKTVQAVQKEISKNATLRGLFEKAEQVQRGEIADDTLAQQYSIRVTDNDGNRLADDRIIVEAGNGNQIEMSVDEFTKLDRKSITAMLT